MRKYLVLIVFLFVGTLFFTACCPDPSNHFADADVFELTQVDEEQRFTVSWDDEEAISKLEVTVKHGKQIVAKKTFEGDDLADKKVTIEAYYGKHDVSIKVTSKEGCSHTLNKEIALSASEYVIAPISGSMPQLYFTLNMKEITNNGEIPAFVWLTRPDSWNWDNLPENIYAMPTVDKREVLIRNNYDRMVEVTDAYIEELFGINSSSKFNLYINDYNIYLYLKLLVANGIPEENYYVTLLSDGGASYSSFNEAFDSTREDFDAYAKYAQMSENLDILYNEVKEAKDYNWTDNFVVDTDTFRQYAYVAAKEKDNVEWWLLRPRAGVLRSPDEEFINTVLTTDKAEGIIEERNFATPLNNMTDEEKAKLKTIYNFNNEMFEEAEKQGKKAMMILGSWANAEYEPDFEAYVKLIKSYYGDEFVYYYKGHPNTPTSNYPEKQAQLERLGLIDVESSINAELILFFYPDIYMCGYNSSTFMSVESREMACAMFNMRKADCTNEYKDLIGIYISKIAEPEDSEFAELLTDKAHSYFLMEYNDMDDSVEADIGIYDDTENIIRYYKYDAGKYVEIAADNA